jgi:hypothetical protein
MKKALPVGGISTLLLVVVLFVHCALGPGKSGSYTLSAKADGVTVDYGEFLSVYDPLEFRVPLSLLGLTADSVRDMKSSCHCTIAEIRADDEVLLVKYEPPGRTIEIYQIITIIPYDSNEGLKFVRLKGKIIPAWFTQPCEIRFDGVHPGVKRSFSASAEINYDLPQIGVDSVRLEPEADNISLDYEMVSNEKIVIAGSVTGLPQADEYKGNIEIVFDTGQFEKLRLPIKIGYLGTISAGPEVVTFDGAKQAKTVEFAHFNGNPLDIQEIHCPEHLEATVVDSAEGRCLVKIGLKNGVLGQIDEVIASKVKVDFAGIDQPGLVRVMILPAALNKI